MRKNDRRSSEEGCKVIGNENSQLELLAVGDLMMGCAYFHTLVNDSIPDRFSAGEPLISNEVVETLRKADLLFGNLECVVSSEFEKRDGDVPPRLMAPIESMDVLERCGFDVLNLANNHILDHGPAYVEETVDLLGSRDIRHIGNPLDENRGLCVEWNGTELWFGGFYLPELGDEWARREVEAFVEKTQGEDRLTVVSLHWGLGMEHMRYPAPEQVEFARSLVDRGADIILGHHSHTFQPVERYGDGVIAYSLGNFIFDMWRKENRASGILKITVDESLHIESTVLPTEQVDYQVGFTDDEFIQETLAMPVETGSAEAYGKKAKKVRRAHRLQVIRKYLVNSHRFPMGFHLETWRRWARKAKKEVFR